MAKPNPVVHFEMGYNDKDRAKEFYSKVFGWQMNPMPGDNSGYVVVQTGESAGDMGRPAKPGYINGGLYKKTESVESHAPSLVIAVDDIEQAMKDVEAAGGKILGGMNPDGSHTMKPTMIPNVGLWISAKDTEDNRISLLQPMGM